MRTLSLDETRTVTGAGHRNRCTPYTPPSPPACQPDTCTPPAPPSCGGSSSHSSSSSYSSSYSYSYSSSSSSSFSFSSFRWG